MSQFPIDMVYTWVDGNDPKHQELLATVSGKHKDYCRFADNHELYYSLYSVYKFAPWVRKIFIVVADYQKPNLEGLPHPLLNKITFVKHSEIMPTSALPTFNSMAIESCLHNLPNLSECFIYFNDDTFLGNCVTPEDFFDQDQSGYFLKGRFPVPLFQPFRWIQPWLNVLHHTIETYSYVRSVSTQKLPIFWQGIHQCRPCRKSVLQKIWNHPVAKNELNVTLHSQLRSHYNIHSIYLMYLLGQDSGEITARTLPAHEHFFLNLHRFDIIFPWQIYFFYPLRPKLFCINNNIKKPSKLIEKTLQTALRIYFDGLKPPSSSEKY